MRAFISYSHRDSDILAQLDEHLAVLKRQGLLDAWTDRQIPAGGIIADHVDDGIETADLYLLLVSSAFIASDYCMKKEFARALERHKAGEATIVPIIIRECHWQIPELRKFKALPKDGKAITGRYWHTADEAYADVAAGLHSLLETPAEPKRKLRASTSQKGNKNKFRLPDLAGK